MDDASLSSLKLANDPKFFMACIEHMDSTPKLQSSPFQSISDRARFIEILKKYGFEIIPIQPPIVG